MNEQEPIKKLPLPPQVDAYNGLSAGEWGMVAFLLSEVAFFSTLIVAYLYFYGRDSQPGGLGGPTPLGALSLGLVVATTACLLSSSITVHFAERSLKWSRHTAFLVLWGLTITLGALFLVGTAYEWYKLITQDHLTVSRNLFGTTYYTLVGFHAFHVTSGVLVMTLVLCLALAGRISQGNRESVLLISWFWHFVDLVWVVVFSVVYVMPHV